MVAGNQDNVWRKAHVSIPPSSLGNFTLRFTATTGNGPQGDIAIDDLAIADGV